ncbi:MAG: DNA-binding beta-propeller fold protein YncE [Myxococcota bacterium]
MPILLVAAGCSSTEAAFRSDSGAEASPSAGSGQDGGGGGGGGGGAETEVDRLALPPAQTDVFVFIANPNRNTVTRVNVNTNEVRTAPVGRDPQLVLTTPDYSTAAVFNAGDDSVSIVDADTLTSITVPVRDNFNRMVLSPDGRWVALWHDLRLDEGTDPPDGLQSFNEVSFVELATGVHDAMAVGFDPRSIQFTDDGTLAVVVSDASLALVDLTADLLEPELIELAPDELDPPAAEEVVLTPDGTYALVRQRLAEDLLVVDLLARTIERVPVGLEPTDVDLVPDSDMVAVVARGSNEVFLLSASDPLAPADVINLPDGIPLGSVLFDPQGTVGVFYTTASRLDRYATWDLRTDEVRLRTLVKPVTGMAITPTGDSMMAFHTKTDAPDADPDSPFAGAWAISLISLANDFLANPLRLEAEPTGYANASNGNHGYFVMEGEKTLVRVNYSSLLHDNIALKSEPVFVGVLPDLDDGDGDEPAAWVSQLHDLGRISFYDPDDASLETITGFELNSQIEVE